MTEHNLIHWLIFWNTSLSKKPENNLINWLMINIWKHTVPDHMKPQEMFISLLKKKSRRSISHPKTVQKRSSGMFWNGSRNQSRRGNVITINIYKHSEERTVRLFRWLRIGSFWSTFAQPRLRMFLFSSVLWFLWTKTFSKSRTFVLHMAKTYTSCQIFTGVSHNTLYSGLTKRPHDKTIVFVSRCVWMWHTLPYRFHVK